MSAWALPPELADTPFGHPAIDSAVYAGWHALLADLHVRLKAIDPGYRVDQFKEKFGTLRVYVVASAPELLDGLHAAVDVAAVRSAVTCEYCGAPGTLRTDGWRKTTCDRHAPRPTHD